MRSRVSKWRRSAQGGETRRSKPVGDQAACPLDSRTQIAACLGLCTQLPWVHCQLIVRDKNQARLTSGAVPRGHLGDVPAKPLEQRSDHAGMMSHDAKANPNGERRCVLDLCTLHVSEPFWTWLCFLLPGKTSSSQNLRPPVHASFQNALQAGHGGPLRADVRVRRCAGGRSRAPLAEDRR